jgi:hypothetical protein
MNRRMRLVFDKWNGWAVQEMIEGSTNWNNPILYFKTMDEALNIYSAWRNGSFVIEMEQLQ